MSDIDAFLDGRGRLGALVRALPPFEPPAHMEARFLATLPGTSLPDADGLFAPPPSLEAAIVAEAARLDTAQAPRRQAVLDEIARDGTDATFGATLTPETRRWLAGQQRPATPPPPRRRRRGWLAPLGGALAATLALGVALQLMWDRPPLTQDAAFAPPAPAAVIREEVAPAATAEAKAHAAPSARRRAPAPTGPQADAEMAPAPPAAATVAPLARQRAQAAHKPLSMADDAQSRPEPAPTDQAATAPRAAFRAKAEELGAMTPAPPPAAPPAERRLQSEPDALAGPAPAVPALAPAAPSTKPAGRRFAPDDIDGMARWIAETPDGPDVWQLSGAISQRADLTRAAEALRAHPLLRDRALTIRVAWSNTPDATLLLGPVQTPE